MRLRLTVVVFLCLSLGCQATIADVESRFQLDGRLVDEAGAGLAGVKIYFVDTGIDEWRAKLLREELLGESDASGQVSIAFTYPWGYTRRNARLSIPGTFRLVLRKEELRPIHLDFRLADLPRRGLDYIVQITATLSRTPPTQ